MSSQSSKTMGPSGWFAMRCLHGVRPNAGLAGRVRGQLGERLAQHSRLVTEVSVYLSETVSPSRSSDLCAERIQDGVRRFRRPICQIIRPTFTQAESRLSLHPSLPRSKRFLEEHQSCYIASALLALAGLLEISLWRRSL